MASADILRAARARIEDPKNWTRGSYARDRLGRGTESKDADAVCWCAYGALRSVSTLEFPPEARLLNEAAWNLHTAGTAEVNDRLGHAAVLKVFDDAIAAAEAEAGR